MLRSLSCLDWLKRGTLSFLGGQLCIFVLHPKIPLWGDATQHAGVAGVMHEIEPLGYATAQQLLTRHL